MVCWTVKSFLMGNNITDTHDEENDVMMSTMSIETDDDGHDNGKQDETYIDTYYLPHQLKIDIIIKFKNTYVDSQFHHQCSQLCKRIPC